MRRSFVSLVLNPIGRSHAQQSLLLQNVVRNEILVVPNKIICDSHILQVVSPSFSPVWVDSV